MTEQISYALHSALLVDLSPIEEKQYRYENGKTIDTGEVKTRRPYENEVEVFSFPQPWSSTSLGFGGIGGQAFTTVQTTVVIMMREACVYFGGRLAYKVEKIQQNFYEDLKAHNMKGVAGAKVYRK